MVPFSVILSLRAVTFFEIKIAVADREIVAFSCLLGEIIAINFVFDGGGRCALIFAFAYRLQRRRAVQFIERLTC